jgi:hypothetical protein
VPIALPRPEQPRRQISGPRRASTRRRRGRSQGRLAPRRNAKTSRPATRGDRPALRAAPKVVPYLIPPPLPSAPFPLRNQNSSPLLRFSASPLLRFSALAHPRRHPRRDTHKHQRPRLSRGQRQFCRLGPNGTGEPAGQRLEEVARRGLEGNCSRRSVEKSRLGASPYRSSVSGRDHLQPACQFPLQALDDPTPGGQSLPKHKQ